LLAGVLTDAGARLASSLVGSRAGLLEAAGGVKEGIGVSIAALVADGAMGRGAVLLEVGAIGLNAGFT
jgi:hypothetical protein